MDSSIRIRSNNFDFITEQALRKHGFLLLPQTLHYNGPVTHWQTLEYLPTNRTRHWHTVQYAATAMFYVNTKHNFESVFKWLLMCALTPSCIAPHDAERQCHKGFKNATKLAQCHRFDQAVVNVLLSNHHDFDTTQYGLHPREVRVSRHDDELPPNCDSLLQHGPP